MQNQKRFTAYINLVCPNQNSTAVFRVFKSVISREVLSVIDSREERGEIVGGGNE